MTFACDVSVQRVEPREEGIFSAPVPARDLLQQPDALRVEPALGVVSSASAHPRTEVEALLLVGARDRGVVLPADEGLECREALVKAFVSRRPGPAGERLEQPDPLRVELTPEKRAPLLSYPGAEGKLPSR